MDGPCPAVGRRGKGCRPLSIDPEHARRRRQLLERLGPDAAVIVPAGPELRIGADGETRYQPDASLYHLTAYVEPEAVAVLCASCEEGPFVLFVRPRDAERERWAGRRGGVEAAREVYGATAAHPIVELGDRLPGLIGHVGTVYYRLQAGRAEVDAAVLALLAAGRRSRVRSGRGVHTIADPSLVLDPLRLVKDAGEIARLREAARITVEAFVEAAPRIMPGAGEWQIEAALDGGFRSRRASGPAFPTIVAGGANAAVLHYTDNAAELRAGELVLVDAGARAAMYCADVSRTFPVSGRFSSEQRDLLCLVLAAQRAGIAAVRPGARLDDVHDAVLTVLRDGLVGLGFLDAAAAPGTDADTDPLRAFYPHRSSHWLGLDVHDAGTYVDGDGVSCRLVPGMVLTVEPGLYIPMDATRGPAALRGTGIRIEDDVLVTPDGHEILTAALPSDPDDIVHLMA
jgi:Xaa-Pro aminopeptidase